MSSTAFWSVTRQRSAFSRTVCATARCGSNRRLYRTLMERPAALRLEHTYDQMFRYVFAPILERYHVPGPDRNYMMAFYIRGVTAIVAEWLKNDCTEPVGQIVGIIQRCIPPPTEE